MIVALVLLALALIGAPLFVIVAVVTTVAYSVYTDAIDGFTSLTQLIAPMEGLVTKGEFLAIPLFMAAGAIMTRGGLAERLVRVMKEGLGWLPGGLGVASVAACMFFAAISGSSPVTLIAVGSIMVPAMLEQKYPENFSLGIVMTAGSLGCLVPPAISMLIYAISVSALPHGNVDPSQLFIAGLVPAVLIAGALAVYSIWVGRGVRGERHPFRWRAFWQACVDGVWALLLPLVVLGGIYYGLYTPSKAGAVAVVYALVVTMGIYRELDVRGVIDALAEAGKLIGMLILIIGLAFGLNDFLALIRVDQALKALIERWQLGPVGFLLLVNVVLIVLGALMDSISATLIFAPMLAPLAVEHYGMDPLHFGVVFVVNMEIGYLMPPVATNLFVAAAVFKKPFGQVSKAVLPTLAITIAGLLAFMYVPTLSKGLVNYQAGLPVWEPFPWDGRPQSALAEESAGGGALGAALDRARARAGLAGNAPGGDAGAGDYADDDLGIGAPGGGAGAGDYADDDLGIGAPGGDAGAGDYAD
ncbi:MAG: TRAP transporter large permease subunit, partial [Deltaproteobacteria bacterium]